MATDTKTEKRDARIRDLSKTGKTYAEIGKTVGLSSARVALIVRYPTKAAYAGYLQSRKGERKGDAKAKAHGKTAKKVARKKTIGITKAQSARKPKGKDAPVKRVERGSLVDAVKGVAQG